MARKADITGASPPSLEIALYDEINTWSVREIVRQLQSAPDSPVTLRINSPGGDVQEGFALASALRTHRGRKVAVVEGVCASAATFPACACDELQMHAESMLMVHCPWGGASGDAEEIEKYAQVLRQMQGLMCALYQRKTGKDEQTVRAWMDAETWMTPREAKEAGFCDVILTDASTPSARARTARIAALLKIKLPLRVPNGTPKNKRNSNMDETLRAKLALHGLADDGGNLDEAYSKYMSETEDGPAERKEVAKAVEELRKECAKAEAEPDEDDKDKGEDKGEKAMARVVGAMERQLKESESERTTLAKKVATLEAKAAEVELADVIADAKSRGLSEAEATEFYKEFGKTKALKWLGKFPKKVSSMGKWNLGGGTLPVEGTVIETVNGVRIIGRGLSKMAQQILAKGEAKTLGEAQILAAKRAPHLYQTASES